MVDSPADYLVIPLALLLAQLVVIQIAHKLSNKFKELYNAYSDRN